MNVEHILERGQKLFSDRFNLLNLWQELAENFYPERADFTDNRLPGDEVTEGLATSKPVLRRRDLGNAIGSILRPTNKPWFNTRVDDWDQVGTEGRAWLDMTEDRQRRAMYHRDTKFSRATKEADNDFATFGQAVMQITRNIQANGLLFRTWHLRDCAWSEDSEGTIDTVYRKWETTAQELKRIFRDKVHPEVNKAVMGKEPNRKFKCMHVFMRADAYDMEGRNKRERQWVSLYIDVANKHVMEEVFTDRFEYLIPRWQTVSGSQYAYSAATVAALPDARTIQSMMITLLEAGEKAVTPPLLGVQGALRSDVNVMAGGLTWVDREYDERLGEVLRPLTVDKSGIPLGLDMKDSLDMDLREAFFLNVLSLPPQDVAMTAYEVGHRVQEYIRKAMPLFEPMEIEYNAPMCEVVFEILFQEGVFGPPQDMPRELAGRNVNFQFESPLHDAVERVKVQKYLEAISLVSNAAGVDPSVIHILDIPEGARDALHNSGMPEGWLRTKSEVKSRVKAEQEAQQMQATLENMQAGAEVAKTIGDTSAPSGTAETGAPLI